MLCAAQLALAAAPAGPGPVLLLKSRELAPYEEAARGFLQQWKSLGSAGPIVQRTLDGANPPAAGNPPPAAVVAIGTEAALWAIKNTPVPVVFCMVANARQNVLEGLRPADVGRVAGVSLNVPPQAQFAALREVLPRVRRVGVLFDPQKSAIAVRDATAAAAAMNIELVLKEVPTESALPEAAAWIASRVDALWAPVDATVFNSQSAPFVLQQMLRNHIPVVGFSENLVKAGALLAPRVSFESAGRQTASLLQKMLARATAAASTLEPPGQFELVANSRVNKLLNSPITAAGHQRIRFLDEN